MRVIILILIGLTSLVYTANINGVVLDNNTGLEWQDTYVDNNNSIKKTTWEDAIKYCEDLVLDYKDNWRLPNINELTSLADDSKSTPLNSLFINKIDAQNYWTSTTLTLENNYNFAWVVYFGYIGYSQNSKTSNNYIRCVR